MRTNQLMLYKNMEHGELLQDMTFLMENCENEYYNKELYEKIRDGIIISDIELQREIISFPLLSLLR